jgi:hypothetical protein
MFTPATTNLIRTVLGPVLGKDTDPHALRRRHAEGSTEQQLLGLVLLAARRLSDLEKSVRERAGSTTGILSRLTARLDAGQACQPHGELQSTGLDVDLLAARHADAHQWLLETLRAYRDAVAPQ